MCPLSSATCRHPRPPRSGATQRVQFVQPDHLGSPRVVIDAASNTAVWKWELTGEAFGATPPNQDPDGDGTAFTLNMRFPGQRFDAATGLNYNYFRDYEPGAGRYVQSDPIGIDGGLATYQYASASPLMYSDPTGENPVVGCIAGSWAGPIGCGVGGVVGAIVGGVAVAAIMSTPGDSALTGEKERAECPEDNDPCKGIRKQLEKHKRKLAEYIANPRAHDNQDLLGQGNDAQVIAWRISSLRKQIAMWERELAKCEANHGR